MKLAETDDLDQALEHVKSIAGQFVVTRGAQGAIAYDGQTAHDIAPVPTTAIDTVGAGDMFAGAFLYGLTQGMGFGPSGELAARASARLVTQFGPRLDVAQTREVLRAFKAGN